ncbi:MAG TPA: ATP-binding protein [Oligoflexus sp.]|uniref:ATP-binding protein n=1 Tax=Oligoflexus sp. TaxID=1971216 RepID=UPI002D7F3DD6|nr:ATP-binding protein [Oligoflexus sp.]HET9241624.1 ATP-binding protein [Oligoflexus sp.]
MFKPSGFLRNQVSEREVIWVVNLASLCGVVAYVPFGFIYPLILGPATVDPLWERLALAAFASLGFLLPRFPQTRPWMQAFIYLLCFIFTTHLFFLVCRNDLNMAYQMGYVCTIAFIAFYLDTNFIFVLYVVVNYILLGLSLFFKISYDNLFFGMTITTVLGIEWIALHSRLRIMKSLERSRAAIQEKNQKIQSILENIQQGVLTIESPNGQIGAEYSAYLDRLLGFNSPNQAGHLQDILERTQLSKDQIEQVNAAVFCIIGENDVALALNYHLFPRSVIEGEGSTARYLELDWNPIFDCEGRVAQLLVCIRDVTELHKLRADAAKGQQELTLLAELVNIPGNRRLAVLEASRSLLMRLPWGANASQIQVMRLLHNLKGNARSFGLSTLAQAAHECETAVQQGHPPDASLVEPLNKLIECYLDIAEHKLGHGTRKDDEIRLSRSRLKKAAAVLESLPSVDRKTLQPLVDIVMDSLHLTLEQILEPHLKMLPQLACDLGKAPPRVHIGDPGIYWQPESADFLANVGLHLLRNSLDHGLEIPNERINAGKVAEGQISLVLQQRKDGIEILVRDDGRGLNLNHIREKAQRLGLLAPDASLRPEEIAEFIFHPGFSTRNKATQISGRGVGLDVVRAMLQEAGGHVQLVLDDRNSFPQASFAFVLYLPSCHLAQWGSLSA